MQSTKSSVLIGGLTNLKPLEMSVVSAEVAKSTQLCFLETLSMPVRLATSHLRRVTIEGKILDKEQALYVVDMMW